MNDSVRRFITWRAETLADAAFSRAPLPLSASPNWRIDATGIQRADQRFFAIVGVRHTKANSVETAPMLYQREFGLSACAIRHTPDGPEWLMQCKVEPGNTHGGQLAPTVDATQSNLERAHVGSEPPLVHLITGAPTILAKGLWSDAGTHFLGARTEYRSVLIEDVLPVPTTRAFRWLHHSDMRTLLAEEYAMSSAARSVVATGPWDLLASSPEGPFSGPLRTSYHASDRGVANALGILKDLHKARTFPEIIPLADVANLVVVPDSVTPIAHPTFDVHHLVVEASTREVQRWDQPLIAPHGVRRTALLLAPDPAGVLRARLFPDVSPGLIHSTEWTATVADAPGAPQLPLPAHEVLATAWFSESGSRCDNVQHQIIVALTETPPPPAASETPYVDLTLGALERLVHTPGAVSSELRSAVALLLHLA